MTDTSPEATTPAPAPRRRRPIVIALGVLVLVLLALAAWVATRPPSPTGDRDLALSGVLSYGGPEGWPVAKEPAAQPSIEGTEPGAQWTERDGKPVLLGDNGFTVLWATTPATAQACADLAEWAGKRMDPAAAPDVTASCPSAIASPPGDARIISSYGTPPGEHGRYLFSAWVGPLDGQTALWAGLTYEGPSDTANALR
ncbi:hypothetical protein BJY16_002743 [Actinoplanes octamycinicus]|uniref:Uncharacterized protein n=1 Tax=Actinoplanes octamycinicus TaxID=135948 RepID=A0A7W7GVX5_9ACTN|nr:hypothetical protein [Actinoplanes octamycinicus]MBB4739284.1 hypothetical protein [Actinoplanes octamycinicus]